MRWFKSLTISLILSGCSASWHLKQAIRKGANVGVDTVYKEVKVIVPEVQTDTVFTSEVGDTVYIEKEQLKIKYLKLKGDSVYIEGKCDTDTIIQKVPYTVTKHIEAPPDKGLKWWHILFWILGAFGAGWILRAITR